MNCLSSTHLSSALPGYGLSLFKEQASHKGSKTVLQDNKWRPGPLLLLQRLNEVVLRAHGYQQSSYVVSQSPWLSAGLHKPSPHKASPGTAQNKGGGAGSLGATAQGPHLHSHACGGAEAPGVPHALRPLAACAGRPAAHGAHHPGLLPA